MRLEDQDRSRWDAALIAEADGDRRRAEAGPAGRFTLQAAIAALHAAAPSYEDTDWPQLLELYDALLRVWPSPVVALNRAVVVAMVSRARGGAWRRSRRSSATAVWRRTATCRSTKADLLRRLGRHEEAGEAYRERWR